MALKVILDSLDDVPEAVQSEYVEKDGKFVLQLDGAYSAIDRDNLQKALKKERDEHKTAKQRLQKYGELTPEALEELRSKNEELTLQIETLGSTDEAERTKKIDELAERRALARIKPIERQFNELKSQFEGVTGERDTLLRERKTNAIVNAVTDPVVLKEAGIVPDAVEDIKLWGLAHFDVDENGKVVSKESIGTPGLAPKDVFGDLKTNGQRRHWFGTTTGAGASGGKGSESFSDNPFAQGTFNLSKIGLLVKNDPQKAVRMAKAATSKSHDALKFLPKALRPAA